VKIRVYFPYCPFPIQDGASQVVADQLRALDALGHVVELITWKKTSASSVQRWGNHTHWNEAKGVKHSAPARVVRSFLSQAASPELYYYPLESDHRAGLDLADLGIYHYGFSHSWLSRGKNPAEKRTVVHFHNLENELFNLRAKSSSNPLARWIHLRNARLLETHQAELAEFVDEAWFLSNPDLSSFEITEAASGIQRILVPPTYDLARSSRKARAGQEGVTLGFVGSLDFIPNIESALWIVNRLCPALQGQGFSGKLRIVGKCPPASLIESAKRFEFVQIEGFQENLDDFWNEIDLMLVPHLSGSGSRIKLLDALARRIPTLANAAAVERVAPEVRSDPRLYVSETPGDWAKLVTEKRQEITFLSRSPDAPPPSPGLEGKTVYSEALSRFPS
jgi:hypothetical protein